MKAVKFNIFLLIFFLISTEIHCQVKEIGLPEIRNFKRADYKGGTQNWAIDQDKNGNLYFANNTGLFQFDGSTWSKYSLPNLSEIRVVLVDDSDKIYVGGYDEFGYFKADEKGKLRYNSLSSLVHKSNRKQTDFIWKIHVHNQEIVFQSFERIFIFDGKIVRQIEAPNRFQFSFKANNRLIIQDKTLGLLEFSNNSLIPLKNTDGLNNTEVWGIFPLSANQLLITTQNKGLFIYENEILTPWNTEANLFIKKNGGLGGAIIKNDFFVLNSVLDGIIICDKNGRIIQRINQKKGLQNNTVLCSFIDSKSNLWLGLDNGIAFVNEGSPFTYFGFSYDISTVYASAIYQGNLYVATNRGLFCHAWTKPFREDMFTLVEGTTGQAWNIQVVDNQLFCSHNRGLLLISNKKTTKIIDSKGYWGLKKIPNQPKYLIGSNYNGFAILEKNGSNIKLKNQIEGFSKSSNNFEFDGNNIWLKKDELLFQLKLSQDFARFKAIKSYQNLSKTLKGITSIQQINQRIYFQTDNHFYIFSEELNEFFEDKKLSNLFKDLPNIQSCFQDYRANIWYVYQESLGLLKNIGKEKYRNIVAPFSNLTGNLVANYLSINSIDSQNIFIGLTNGLAHFDAQSSNIFSSKPHVYIRSFSHLSDTIIFGNTSNSLKESYEIPYKSNNVKFTSSSPIYENLENMEFSYKLEGFDENWSNWTPVTIKEYTNLREGNYKMNVKVRNSYGVLSEPDVISFTVYPPFYRHFLAYLFYFVALIYGIYRLRKQVKLKIQKNKHYETIEQRRIYLEKEAKIKLEQYELEKEIENLKVENLKIKLLAKDKELVNNSFQVVKKNKVLNGIIHKLKDINIENLDDSTKSQFNRLNKSIVKEVNADNSWKDLEKHIKNVHFDFLKRLKEKYPTISPRELDLATYLLLNMSTKEIAEIINISSAGVELARYRLRKKMGLTNKENLVGFLMGV